MQRTAAKQHNDVFRLMFTAAFPDLLTLGKQSLVCALQRCAEKMAALSHQRISSEGAGAPVLVAVDGTCGNGYDTLFLAESLQQIAGAASIPWQVLGFDVQEQAIQNTQERLAGQGHSANIRLQVAGHERVSEFLNDNMCIAVAVYNLGYLPGSDKSVITGTASTLASLQCVTEKLLPEGLVSVHTYGGHEGGLAEMRAVEIFLGSLSFSHWRVARYALCNKEKNKETLFLAQKIKL